MACVNDVGSMKKEFFRIGNEAGFLFAVVDRDGNELIQIWFQIDVCHTDIITDSARSIQQLLHQNRNLLFHLLHF